MSKVYASVSWSVDDVLTLRPNWTRKQAAEWLAENERYIQDDMVARGWDSIEALLPAYEGDNIEED